MTREIGTSPTDLSAHESSGVQRTLEELRGCLAVLDTPPELDAKLWSLSQLAEDMASEHEGMAEELLGTYEQLGIVFDVTRKLATVDSEAEVLRLFTASLRSSYSNCKIAAAYPHGPEGWVFEGDAVNVDDWMRKLIRRARDDRAVTVEARSRKTEGAGDVQVMVGPVFGGDAFMGAIIVVQKSSALEFHVSDMMLLEALSMFCGDLIRNHRLVSELRQMSLAMVRSLVNAVDQKDPYTSGHSLRVGYYATMLAARIGFSERDLQMLQWSALLHDVGKIGIRDDVLKKEGKLTEEEFTHIKEHPVRSHQVVEGIPQLAEALDGVLYHHEHYAGGGYPTGLKGEEIPLQARVIQVADIFDALTSDRSYRKAFDWRRALGILEEEAGKVVDPEIVVEFIDMIKEITEGDEGAWERLVERASAFSQIPRPAPDTTEYA